MDDIFSTYVGAEELCAIAQQHEASLRALHKRLRWSGCHEASYACLDAADTMLRAARALAAELPPKQPPAARRTGTGLRLVAPIASRA